jgi:hypothetical protein
LLGNADRRGSTVPRIKRRLYLGVYRDPGIENREINMGNRLLQSEVAKFCVECVQMDHLAASEFEINSAEAGFYKTGILEGVGLTFARPYYSTPTLLSALVRNGPSYRKRLIDQGSFPIIDPKIRPGYTAAYRNIGGRSNAVVFIPPNSRCHGVTQLLVDTKTGNVVFANPVIYSTNAYTQENVDAILACVKAYFVENLPIAEFKVPFFYFLNTGER